MFRLFFAALHSFATLSLSVTKIASFSVEPRILSRPRWSHQSCSSIHAISNESCGGGKDDDVNENESAKGMQDKTSIEEELERLQQTLATIEALEERNKAQLDSFVDEKDQWNSMEEFERELLDSKDDIVERMEKITEELLQMWMGAKSMEG